MSSVASYQQAVEYIEWSGRVFVQLYLEDTIIRRKETGADEQ